MTAAELTAREDAERAARLPAVYNNERLQTFAQDVATLLGEGWRYEAMPNDSLWHLFAHLVHADGRRLCLAMEENRPTRLQAYGMIDWEGAHAPGCYQVCGHTITMDAAKLPAHVTADIRRRLLPEYTATFATETAKRAERRDYEGRLQVTRDQLTAAGLKFGVHTYDSMAYLGKESVGYGDVRVNGPDSVDLHIRGVRLETALRLLAVIRKEGS